MEWQRGLESIELRFNIIKIILRNSEPTPLTKAAGFEDISEQRVGLC